MEVMDTEIIFRHLVAAGRNSRQNKDYNFPENFSFANYDAAKFFELFGAKPNPLADIRLSMIGIKMFFDKTMATVEEITGRGARARAQAKKVARENERMEQSVLEKAESVGDNRTPASGIDKNMRENDANAGETMNDFDNVAKNGAVYIEVNDAGQTQNPTMNTENRLPLDNDAIDSEMIDGVAQNAEIHFDATDLASAINDFQQQVDPNPRHQSANATNYLLFATTPHTTLQTAQNQSKMDHEANQIVDLPSGLNIDGSAAATGDAPEAATIDNNLLPERPVVNLRPSNDNNQLNENEGFGDVGVPETHRDFLEQYLPIDGQPQRNRPVNIPEAVEQKPRFIRRRRQIRQRRASVPREVVHEENVNIPRRKAPAFDGGVEDVLPVQPPEQQQQPEQEQQQQQQAIEDQVEIAPNDLGDVQIHPQPAAQQQQEAQKQEEEQQEAQHQEAQQQEPPAQQQQQQQPQDHAPLVIAKMNEDTLNAVPFRPQDVAVLCQLPEDMEVAPENNNGPVAQAEAITIAEIQTRLPPDWATLIKRRNNRWRKRTIRASAMVMRLKYPPPQNSDPTEIHRERLRECQIKLHPRISQPLEMSSEYSRALDLIVAKEFIDIRQYLTPDTPQNNQRAKRVRELFVLREMASAGIITIHTQQKEGETPTIVGFQLNDDDNMANEEEEVSTLTSDMT